MMSQMFKAKKTNAKSETDDSVSLREQIIHFPSSQIDYFIEKSRSTPRIGNPSPLGLAAFALTTFVLSVFNAGSYLIDTRLESLVLPLALFYGGIVQAIAGFFEFQLRNTFAATTFASYGAFWMSFAAYVYLIVPKIEYLNKTNQTNGLFLLSWWIFTLYMTVAAYKVSRAILSVFIALNFTFLFLIVGNFAKLTILINIGGWFGIVTAILAWYTSAALMINTTFKRDILPLGGEKEK